MLTTIVQCGQLAGVLGSKVSFPGNAAYETTQESYFSLQEAALSPACIVVPGSAQDVAEAVTIISGIESCHFAIKGQTHAPAAGFANINSGVTIDMTSLNSVAVNADHTVASIGGGSSWLQVYTYLDSLDLAVAGGRNGAVGVGGLTLGGGISYFAPRVGWACDNAVNFEVSLQLHLLGLSVDTLGRPRIRKTHQRQRNVIPGPLPRPKRGCKQFRYRNTL
jgi:FAD/FMN-containing dehydrogenase